MIKGLKKPHLQRKVDRPGNIQPKKKKKEEKLTTEGGT